MIVRVRGTDERSVGERPGVMREREVEEKEKVRAWLVSSFNLDRGKICF